MKQKNVPEYKHSVSPEDSQHYFACSVHRNVDAILHVNFSMEIVIVDEGKLHVKIGNNEYDINAGQAVFVQPFEAHSFLSKEDNLSRVIVFSADLAEEFFEFIKSHSHKGCLFDVSEDVLSFVRRVMPENADEIDNMHAKAILAPLCYEITEKLCFEESDDNFEDVFLKALQYINRHFPEKLSLNTVAKEVGIHPVTLSRKFTHNANMSFNSYLNYQRCSYAAMLIEKSGVSFTDAAYASGFGSIRSFNRVFLERYGVTPSEFKHCPEKIRDKFYH